MQKEEKVAELEFTPKVWTWYIPILATLLTGIIIIATIIIVSSFIWLGVC